MSTFGKNVFNLTVGNIIAQAISLAAIPIITRIYSPGDYGTYAIYLSITMILFPVSTLHFDRVIMISKNHNDAKNLLVLSLLSVTSISLLLTGCIFSIDLGIFGFNASISKKIMETLWLVPLGVFMHGCSLTFLIWALRNKLFGDMAAARVTESVADKTFVLSAGFFSHAGYFGLIFGRIIGPFVALCYLARRTINYETIIIFRSVSLSAFKRLIRRYREFQFFSILSDFISTLSREIPLLLLTLFFSSATVGFYALAVRVVRMPMLLIGEAIFKVFLQRIADEKKKEKLITDATRLFSYMIYITFPPTLILLYFGENLFGLIFGSDWSRAGTFTQIIALSFFAMFLYRPLSAFFDIFERQKQKLVVSSLLLLARAGAIITGTYLGASIKIALTSLVASTSLVYIGAYFYLFGLLGVDIKSVIGILVGKIAVMTPLIFGLLIMKFLFHEHLMILTAALICMILLQAGAFLLAEPYIRKKILSF